jgi:hypothetical protein
MDMKKILQALSEPSVPKEGSDSMKKFIGIINEGASPHKVSLPVQMAMNHYSTPVEKPKPATLSLFTKYIAEADAAIVKQKNDEYIAKRNITNQYAKYIAERVLMKDSIPGHSPGFTGGVGPGIQPAMEEHDNPKDVVSMDIPLLIRLLEYAREDAQTDMDLHNVTEKLIELSGNGDVLSMHEYDIIVNNANKRK